MSKVPNTHGGGAQTNANGLKFEQTTSLNTALKNAGVDVNANGSVYYKNKLIGYSQSKGKFYSLFLQINGIDYKKYISKKLLPDDALININTKTVYIIEKKFQNTAGSVDEKLQTCEFKKLQYQKLLTPICYKVVYIYVLNDWFHKKEYADVKRYILDKECYYFFNEIPLTFFNLGGKSEPFNYVPEDV